MRNKSIDIARAILTFYIITIVHGIFWLDIIPHSYGSLLLFEMPFIFVISGYAYGLFEQKTKFVLNPQNYISFVISRTSRILIPYFAYAICCLFIVVPLDAQKPPTNIAATILAWLNPIRGGEGHSFGMLTMHLWFIGPFLMVTLFLPLVAKFYSLKIPLWLTAIGLCLTISTIPVIPEPASKLITPIFYLFWAYLGYVFTVDLKIKRSQCMGVLFLGTTALILSRFLLPVTLNMQLNKFPPNWLFFVFSSIWLSLFLFVFSYFNPQQADFLASAKWFKPFIANGYSIYLWQGVGYTSMSVIGSKINLSIYFLWFLAIIITIFLGIFFGPLERIKLKLGVMRT